MIDIAQVCHMIRNYHTCATVITALRQPAIARLKKVAFRESSVFFLALCHRNKPNFAG
jgi:hypothetical protein